MQAASNLIVAIGLAALVILYVLELINTRRGGSPNLSQKTVALAVRSPEPLYSLSLSSSQYGLASARSRKVDDFLEKII